MSEVTEQEEQAPEGGSESGLEPTGQVVSRTPWQVFWFRFRKDKAAIFGLVCIAVILFMAIFAGVIAKNVVHHAPNEVFLREMTDSLGLPKGPNSQFWFGGDRAGRDLFVRVLYWARVSLTVALLATGIAVVIGVALGLAAGFYRGKVDTVISRLTDVVMTLPVLLLALGLVSACGATQQGCLGGLLRPGVVLVILVIGFFSWPYIARIVRGQVMSLREKEFVEASKAMGSGGSRIMAREVLPNLVAPIIVYTTLIIPNNILFEAALSFLGLGVPPTTPSWGAMLSEASAVFTVAWWMMLFPGLFLFFTTLAFNLVGDGLRDALDPRTGR